MARTRDPETHATRRDAFVDAAMRRIAADGYESLSIQDVIDDVGASKGAFYHYFGAKADLLEAVVERSSDAVIAVARPIADDPALAAPAKLQAIFESGGRWKADRRDLMLALIRPWYDDRNTMVRVRTEQAIGRTIAPMLAGVIRQGVAEGAFRVGTAEHAARILVTLFSGSGETLARLFLARLDGSIPFEEVVASVAAYDEAVERILGLAPGSFHVIDDAALRRWFA
jgi:AcrR family transcriptional regulator